MRICTIGFTGKTAETFFTRLKDARIKRIIDVRLNNTGQLAGFSKRDDLRFFAKSILGVDYLHLPLLAPTQPMLDDYKRGRRSWAVYEKEFLALIKSREIEKHVEREVIQDSCLLCSEDKPHMCHRRLVAEYLSEKWGNVQIDHL